VYVINPGPDRIAKAGTGLKAELAQYPKAWNKPTLDTSQNEPTSERTKGTEFPSTGAGMQGRHLLYRTYSTNTHRCTTKDLPSGETSRRRGSEWAGRKSLLRCESAGAQWVSKAGLQFRTPCGHQVCNLGHQTGHQGGKLLRTKRMVPKKGLEPPHPCGYMDLNHARLPIPPLRRVTTCGRRGRLEGRCCAIYSYKARTECQTITIKPDDCSQAALINLNSQRYRRCRASTVPKHNANNRTT
jgi:hypothetical protein